MNAKNEIVIPPLPPCVTLTPPPGWTPPPPGWTPPPKGAVLKLTIEQHQQLNRYIDAVVAHLRAREAQRAKDPAFDPRLTVSL